MPVPVRLAALLALGACTGPGDDGDTAIPDLDPLLTLGTGETAFETLDDGCTAYVVYGPQGGYHINGSLRVQGIEAGNPDLLDDPSNPVTTFRILRDGVEVDMGIQYRQGIDPVPDMPGVYQMIGRRVILDITDDAELDGVELLMQVEVIDVNGVSLFAERTVVGEPDPRNG